jgi:hypothetical protein
MRLLPHAPQSWQSPSPPRQARRGREDRFIFIPSHQSCSPTWRARGGPTVSNRGDSPGTTGIPRPDVAEFVIVPRRTDYFSAQISLVRKPLGRPNFPTRYPASTYGDGLRFRKSSARLFANITRRRKSRPAKALAMFCINFSLHLLTTSAHCGMLRDERMKAEG